MIGNKDKSAIEKLLADHAVLMEYLCGVREWISDVGEWGMPQFGELGTRLALFRETLAGHFAAEEDQECAILESQHSQPAGDKKEWPSLHHNFLKRLDDLVARLKTMQPEFTTWQDAARQMEALVSEICEHEQEEISFLKSSLANSS